VTNKETVTIKSLISTKLALEYAQSPNRLLLVTTERPGQALSIPASYSASRGFKYRSKTGYPEPHTSNLTQYLSVNTSTAP
jgi:hypothetical protein